jgi:hypothetical protein
MANSNSLTSDQERVRRRPAKVEAAAERFNLRSVKPRRLIPGSMYYLQHTRHAQHACTLLSLYANKEIARKEWQVKLCSRTILPLTLYIVQRQKRLDLPEREMSGDPLFVSRQCIEGVPLR